MCSGIILLQFLKTFEGDIIQREYPALSKDGADRTYKEPLSFAKLDAVLKVTCGSGWRNVVDQKTVSNIINYKVTYIKH